MNIVERAERIERLNRHRTDQEVLSTRLGAVQGHWNTVAEDLGELQRQLDGLALLAREGVLVRELPLSLADAQGRCRILREQVAHDSELTLEGRAFKAVADAVRQAHTDLEAYATSEWADFVRQSAPPMRAAEVEADRDHVDPVRRKCARELHGALLAYEGLAARVPSSEVRFREFETARASVDPPLQAFRSASDLPADVEAFFQKANSTSGALLSDLTPKVSKWLVDNGREDLFRIRATND